MKKIAHKTVQKEKRGPSYGEKGPHKRVKRPPKIEINILCSQEGDGRVPTSLPPI